MRCAWLGRRRQADHQLVERALHVEQHGVERARRRRRAPRCGLPSCVAEAERVAQALRRVDGEDGGAPSPSRRGHGRARPPWSSCRRRRCRRRGRGAARRAARRASCREPGGASELGGEHVERRPAASGPANRNGRRTGAVPSARRSDLHLARPPVGGVRCRNRAASNQGWVRRAPRAVSGPPRRRRRSDAAARR